MRGQRADGMSERVLWRIIPARAGPTVRRARYRGRRPGSSPLVRGQQPFCSFRACLVRIIPARAGPTRTWDHPTVRWTDHPRSCGANKRFDEDPETPNGSSPLVRGQLTVGQASLTGNRIIPARAGPTSKSSAAACAIADHPRSCGANHVVIGFHDVLCGSSPLVRGQHNVMTEELIALRIIPARAGPTINTVYA